MIYKNIQSMLRGLTDTLEDGDVVVRADDQRQLLIGFTVDGKEAHHVTLMSVRMRRGLAEDIEDLITTRSGRDRMALAMTHRHPFRGHDCGECSVWEVMES